METSDVEHDRSNRRLWWGILCLALSVPCLMALAQLLFTRYLLEDLLHAMHWRSPLDVLLVLSLGALWAVSFSVGAVRVCAHWRLRGVNLGNMYTVALCVMLLYVMLFPVCTMARENGRFSHGNSCRSHQKQIALHIAMSMQDHGDRLPESWEEFSPTDEWPQMDVDPETRRYFHKIGGYGYNAHLRGKALDSLSDPSTILLTADAIHPRSFLKSVTDIDRTRHGASPRGFNAAFIDGHVDFIPADAAVRFK